MASRKNKGKNNTSINNNKNINIVNDHKKVNYKIPLDNPCKLNVMYILPIVFIVMILPLIIRLYSYETPLSEFSWFTVNNQYTDFFLYYKQWFFISVSLIMVIIIAVKAYLNKEFLKFSPILWPLGIYALLSLLSSVFSKYRNISFSGGYSHFESVFVLLGYCLVVYYIYLIVQSKADIMMIIHCFLIGAIILSIIGFTQYIGRDFFATEFGLRLIMPRVYWDQLDTISFTFEKNRVYGTFYNPNYVGVYAALILPMLLLLTIFAKRLRYIVLYIIGIIGVSICLIGSRSTAGTVSIGISLILALILLWRYIAKYFYFTIPGLLLLVLSLVLFDNKSDDYLTKQLREVLDFRRTEVTLTDIQTLDDEVTITYKGNTISTALDIDGEGITLRVIEEDGTTLHLVNEPDTGNLIIQDERFNGLQFRITMIEDRLAYVVTIDGKDWIFTNQFEDGTYYFLNQYNRLDKIITAPSALFTGFESYASGRGYIWSRSIPLLKDNFILGSGADTYVIEFPQQDYVNKANYGYDDQLITKPHNLYLQIGVQTGTMSLLAFIIFYGFYFLSGIKLYIRSKYDNFYSKVGVAILVGTFSYMVAGLANDSSITVAPLFWVLMGLGIAVNEKARSLANDEKQHRSNNINTDITN